MVKKMFIFIKIDTLHLETSLQKISNLAIEKQQENDLLIKTLKTVNSSWIDEQITALNAVIEPQINCTSCGNCCKTLMINVEEIEVSHAALSLGIDAANFKQKFVEEGSSGRMIINTIPCHFLHDNMCSIYETRFSGCKEFPGLHLPQIKARLFTIMMHYDRCPIIYNVMENLKNQVLYLNQ